MSLLRTVSLSVLSLAGAACLHAAESTAPKPATDAKPGTTATATAKASATVAAPEAATAAAAASDLTAGEFTTTASGLKLRDVKVGQGDAVGEGAKATVHYTGWLTDGKKFDSSRDRDAPFSVSPVGKARVIKGWNEGLLGMKVGGQRRLVIPSDLAYGPAGRPPTIPPAATLVFDIEVLSVTMPPSFPDLKSLQLTTNASGLKWADLKVGAGAEVKAGSTAVMDYAGWLENGTKFDASWDSGRSFPVQNVGNAGVIAGWNEGLQGMKAGGRRVLVIPAKLGYGEQGYPPVIPPNSTLVFVVDANEVR